MAKFDRLLSHEELKYILSTPDILAGSICAKCFKHYKDAPWHAISGSRKSCDCGARLFLVSWVKKQYRLGNLKVMAADGLMMENNDLD